MDKRRETTARIAVFMILVGLPIVTLGYQFGIRPQLDNIRTIDIAAAAPEAGGFDPEIIRVAAGETVRLRFSVPDVTHGIAIGPGLDIDLGNVDPGEVEEVEISIDQPGRYTIYCNTWCSPNHWRMRATIEVYDPNDPYALVIDDSSDPIIDMLSEQGIDIDASHVVENIPEQKPSANRGAEIVARLEVTLPVEYYDREWRQGQSPYAVWKKLRGINFNDKDAWDVVAYLWLMEVESLELKKAASIYAKNCAACHGEYGNGQGPGADIIQTQEFQLPSESGEPVKPPAIINFESMLGGTSNIYYAKLRRGGMGTGMPSFGPIFSPEETRALVDFLWTFVFEEP
jgi:mono/diheme cytochrome c family protein/plastocyanin